jgi:hypothetical protein
MNTQGFYKKDGTQILFEPVCIAGTGYYLDAAEKDAYTYPVDGWIWAEDLDDAINQFADTSTTFSGHLFHVTPEDIYLATAKSDETEFNKLAALVQLGIQQGKLASSTVIKITDFDGLAHTMTIGRFLDVIVNYGLFCYTLRN